MSDIEPADELASLLEDLHDSEINGEISWFYDNVWGAKVGDKLNGYLAETAELPSLGNAARWLCDRALEFYPDSAFAKGTGPRNDASARVVTSFMPPDRPATAARAVGPSSQGVENTK